MWQRKELKERAKEVLRKSYWKAFMVSLIILFAGGHNGGGFNYNFGNSGKNNRIGNHGNDFPGLMDNWVSIMLIAAVVVILIIIAVILLRIFLGYHLEIGGKRYFVKAAQGDADLNNLGFGFEKGAYLDIIKAMLWKESINMLWYLLLIIPGIVKAYAYSMVPYILADNPNIGFKRALKLSKQMTDYHKFSMFVLDLSFIGWYILGVVALFVGTLFVLPYELSTKAELYLVLRNNIIEYGEASYEEFNLVEPVREVDGFDVNNQIESVKSDKNDANGPF